MTLRAENITFGYRRRSPVLNEVSVTIEPGSVTAIVGPNGSGKSTLLRLLAGVATPWSGQASLDGVSITALSAKDRAARLAYVSQRPTIAGPYTVEQVIAMGRYALSRDDDAVDGAMRLLELDAHRDRPALELSIGQQQRVAIARALAQLGCVASDAPTPSHLERKVFLADEPTAAMDPRYVALTMQLLRSLAEQGVAVGVVLHDLSSALRWADRVVLLTMDRRVAAAGKAGEILTPDTLSEIYDVPFELIEQGGRVALLAAAPERSPPTRAPSV
jgi:ABC-type cobalamin/Fe3+-siderophores transport system ATPase subunit